MASQQTEFRPDYAQEHAGKFLGWFLETRGIKKVDFAKRCGRTSKTISEIISGKAPITPETAVQFERVLGESADMWLRLDATYQLQQVRDKELAAIRSDEAKKWANLFPVREMVQNGIFDSRPNSTELAEKMLRFFGVGSIEAFNNYWNQRVKPIRYKQQRNQTVNDKAVIAWLRHGELLAAERECQAYDETGFRSVLEEVRSLTQSPWSEIESKLIELCASVGVAVALIPSLPKTGLRGAAYWAKKDKAVIVLSDHGKHEESFWFAFFHEAAHILLHSKKSIFIDQNEAGNEETSIEEEADNFSAEFLVAKNDIRRFRALCEGSRNSFRAADLERFANELGISPGLLLARLQYENVIGWNSKLNSKFKRRANFA